MSAAGSGGRAGPLPPAPAADRGTLPEAQVRAMFDRVARGYDLLNSVMTAGLHHQWRRRAVEIAGVGPGDRVLDVATGTGDLAIELAKRVAPAGEVIGSDFSEGMLALARKKAPQLRSSGATRWSCPTPTTSSTRRRSASARATSPTSTVGWPS